MVLILSQLIGSVIVGCMPLVNLLLVPEKMALLCTKVTGGRHYSGDQPWDFCEWYIDRHKNTKFVIFSHTKNTLCNCKVPFLCDIAIQLPNGHIWRQGENLG